ncbi:MAG: hypothetical protein WC700_07560 [Gemmatimonadaceae bacterium]|jgi:hypothetical protein
MAVAPDWTSKRNEQLVNYRLRCEAFGLAQKLRPHADVIKAGISGLREDFVDFRPLPDLGKFSGVEYIRALIRVLTSPEIHLSIFIRNRYLDMMFARGEPFVDKRLATTIGRIGWTSDDDDSDSSDSD